MTYLLIKATLSGILIALASETARRWPGIGALILSLPLTSVLAMVWLWRDTADPQRLADHATGTLWFLAPSVPMFLLIPYLLKQGWGFYPALAASCLLTVALYALMVWIGPRFGLKL